MREEHSSWSGRPRALEEQQFNDYFEISTAERLQFVLRSGYGEQSTNNTELMRSEEANGGPKISAQTKIEYDNYSKVIHKFHSVLHRRKKVLQMLQSGIFTKTISTSPLQAAHCYIANGWS